MFLYTFIFLSVTALVTIELARRTQLFYQPAKTNYKNASEKHSTKSLIGFSVASFVMICVMLLMVSHTTKADPIGMLTVVVTVYVLVTIAHNILIKQTTFTPGLCSLLAGTASVAVLSLHHFHPSWATNNFIAMILGIALLQYLSVLKTKHIVMIAIGWLIYDVVSVYGTGHMIELANSVLKSKVAGEIIGVPNDFFSFDETLNNNAIVYLGIGDIVVPGLLILASDRNRLSIPVTLGYLIGILCTLAMVKFTNQPVPALIILVPCTLAALYWSTREKKMNL